MKILKAFQTFLKTLERIILTKKLKKDMSYCAETIKFNAKKCRFCGEWPVESMSTP